MKRNLLPLVLIIVNNHGGGIFDLLPIARQTPHFERFFATPHTFGFEDAARMFGIDYARPGDLNAFAAEYSKAIKQDRVKIIELVTDRRLNAEIRTRLHVAIS